MPRTSAGLLMYRLRDGNLEVLLVHPGGPYWINRDDGAWMIPKGEFEPASEAPLDAAVREFTEETGATPKGPYLPLGEIRQKGGKIVHAWAFRGDLDPTTIRSNAHRVEWPPRSGRWQSYPEVDAAAFYTIDEARRKILASQEPLLDRLIDALGPTKQSL